MRRDSITQRQVSRDAVDHHLAHLIVLAGVCVDVLHPPQARVGLIVVVECTHSLHNIVTQLGNLELLTQEVEVEKWAYVLFSLWVAQGAGVDPADEKLEGEVSGVRKAIGFGFALAILFVIKNFAEERGVVTEELFVYCPASVFCTDVYVYKGCGEKPGVNGLANWRMWERERDALVERLLRLLGGGRHAGGLEECDLIGYGADVEYDLLLL